MDEKELKTSPKQRFFIILIAVIMVGSIIASYAAIVMAGNSSSASTDTGEISEEKIAEYEAAYKEKQAEFSEATKGDFDKFIAYKSEVKAYNETSANENGVQTKDLVVGDGAEIKDGNSDYLAYYVGWCADESIFDSSYDNNDNPTAFAKILDPSLGLIEGWTEGMNGMKVGGIRRITVPGEKAYGDSMEICGGKNKPLRFLVMAVAKKDPLATLAKELDAAYMRWQYTFYGIDYDSLQQ